MINGKRTTASLFRSWVLVLFVGDFGNESVEVVRMIAARHPQQRFWETTMPGTPPQIGRKKSSRSRQRRLGTGTAEFAGETHVGYGKLDSRR